MHLSNTLIFTILTSLSLASASPKDSGLHCETRGPETICSQGPRPKSPHSSGTAMFKRGLPETETFLDSLERRETCASSGLCSAKRPRPRPQSSAFPGGIAKRDFAQTEAFLDALERREYCSPGTPCSRRRRPKNPTALENDKRDLLEVEGILGALERREYCGPGTLCAQYPHRPAYGAAAIRN